MTIIEPNKNRFKINLLMILLAAFIFFEAIFSIFAYSKSVKLNYSIREQKEELEALEVRNADMKNELYAILDFKNAEQLAEKFGLIKEKHPEYLARQ